MISSVFTRRLRESLKESLPGEEGHMGMAPEFRGEKTSSVNPTPAAVLILLFPREGKIGTVFIKRNEYNGPHSAQVSFPGGAWEAGDGSLEKTALRETREELGIKGNIHILGSLTQLHIPVSNFVVTPYVGWMEDAPAYQPDQSEVQYVIETSLSVLMNPENSLSEKWDHHERSILVPFYRVGEEKIWGATAMMLCEFLLVVSRMQPHQW